MNFKQFLFLSSLVSCSQFKDLSDPQFQTAQRVYGNNVSRTEIENIYDSTVKVELTVSKLLETSVMASKVFTGKSSGTGVVLRDSQTDEFYVLTAGHLIEPLTFFTNGEIDWELTAGGIEADVITYELDDSTGADISLLKINGSLPYFQGKIAKQINKKDDLFSVGFPGFMPKTVFFGQYEKKIFEYGLALLVPQPEDGVSGAGVFKKNQHFQYMSMITGEITLDDGKKVALQTLQKVRETIQNSPLKDEYLEP
jgi:hypothetical protein